MGQINFVLIILVTRLFINILKNGQIYLFFYQLLDFDQHI